MDEQQDISKKIMESFEATKILDDNTPTTSDEAQAKAVSTLADTKDHQTMSELDDNEIILLTALQTSSVILNDKILETFVKDFCKFKVSRDRKGRGEIVDIARSAKEESEKRLANLRKIFGARV